MSIEHLSEKKSELLMNDYKENFHIYLLIDCSASMTGEPIEAVRQAIRELIIELKDDLSILENVYISVIVFDSVARHIIPLVKFDNFLAPDINSGGISIFNEALKLLEISVKENKSNFKPIVFVFTDGYLTGEWKDMAKKLKKNVNFIYCIAGAKADKNSLNFLTNSTIILNTLSYGDFSQFLYWN